MEEHFNSHENIERSDLLVWDSEDTPFAGNWITVLWQNYSTNIALNTISIPKIIEEYADKYRSRYLCWIYELGETCINHKRLIDHLEIRYGFSYWWMTPLSEKCNYDKSMQIDDAIKLMAFEDWGNQLSIRGIRLVSTNGALADCLKLWCVKAGVKFVWQVESRPALQLSLLRRVNKLLPYWLQACVWLIRYAVNRWPLRRVGIKEWQSSSSRVSFVSYLDNLVPGAMAEMRYENRYWGHLPEVLGNEGCKTNWLHIYVKDGLLPTARKAADTLHKFNQTGRGVQTHVALDSFLKCRTLFKTMRDWLNISLRSKALQKQVSQTTSKGLFLWPLFEAEWKKSMHGSTAMSNLMYLNLFESAMKFLPNQRSGVYLQENMDWEFAFLWAWKAAGHGCIYGCPHSTVKFWDLRYFFDPRSYKLKSANLLPLPDKVAVNGPEAAQKYRTGGYPAEDLVEVEALRYLYLNDLPGKQTSVSVAKKQGLRLLVLGDYTTRHTGIQMRLLEKTAPSLPAGTDIIVKPHPNCPVEPNEYPGLTMTLTMESIAKLLSECDVAYTSATTSAAVDAYFAGVPVISVLDPKTLNLSPLRGQDNVQFASTPEELLNALKAIATTTHNEGARSEFFRVDSTLIRWKNLLFSQCKP